MTSEQILEFDKIKRQLQEYALTRAAREKIDALEPFLRESDVKAGQRDTTEARKILETMGNPPLSALEGMDEILEIAEHGGCLTEDQLEQVSMTLTCVRRLKDFLNRCKRLELSLPYYEENLDSLDDVREEIVHTVRGGHVEDAASKTLHDIREKKDRTEEKMREKAESALRANKAYLSDSFCVTRNGRICIPIKKSYRGKVAGTVVEQSATGNTIFIQPSAVTAMEEKVQALQTDEENEVLRILYTLTDLLAGQGDKFRQNQRTVEKLDFIFAKGKLSFDQQATEPVMTADGGICIEQGRHPLLDQKICVPLDFKMDSEQGRQGIVITGPNTGGKTVSIKTVGLLCMMAQCGLHVTARSAVLRMNSQYLCDIGDGQNLSENLSTFSSHIKNVLAILQHANRESLVIMDELGSGTDPAEGMGIAIAILEELKKSGALFLVTTHYPEVKKYADETEGVINARMAFDQKTLQPLYRMEIGEAGESCAFYIAQRLGMPDFMLHNAWQAAYGQKSGENKQKDNHETRWKREAEQKEFTHMKGPKIVRDNVKHDRKARSRQMIAEKFSRGDSVQVLPDKKTGIVCRAADESGMVLVQLPGKKVSVSHTRLILQVPASQLYPPDYDFSIIFDSVDERKMRHLMERKYVEGAQICKEKEEK